jgi:hypothetical protein
MALITSAASGNFNAGATWTGGVVPTIGDEARASTGHTITITANATCDEVSNAGTGIFTLNSGVTLTANVTAKSTTATRNCLQFTAASPSTAMIVGTCTGGTVSSAQAVVNTSTGSLAITGNVSAGAGISSVGVQNASTGTVTITGNITGGAGSGAFGVNNSTTGIVTITGNATGGTGSTAYGVNNLTTGTVTITGIATGGSTNGAEGARNLVGGVLSVGRANGNAFGIGSTGIVAGFGVTSGQTSVTKVKEIEYGSRGMSPTSGPIYLDSDLTNVAILVNYPIGTGSKTLSDPNNTAGLSPAATDVRNGVVYNYGVNTGSAYIPSAESVAFGVPVDATTGTATLTAANVRTALGLASANLDTQLAVLSNLDAAVSSRLAPNGTLATVTTLTNAPASVTPAQIRQEMDTNSTQLTSIKAKTDLLETTRLAQCSTVATTGDQIAAAFNSP